jgi:hypothetical protein
MELSRRADPAVGVGAHIQDVDQVSGIAPHRESLGVGLGTVEDLDSHPLVVEHHMVAEPLLVWYRPQDASAVDRVDAHVRTREDEQRSRAGSLDVDGPGRVRHEPTFPPCACAIGADVVTLRRHQPIERHRPS